MLLWKRLTSFALVLVLVAGMLPPIHVRAQETEETVLPEEILETVAPETEEILETVAPETEAPAAVELVPEESVPETTAPAETTEDAGSEEILWIPGQADSEELYEGYLNRLFFGGVSPMGTLARDTLGDTDRYLYDRLKPVLLKIANGEQASAAATVDFSGSGYALANTNLNAVLDALYHDCPYEMYWYNGCYYSYWRNELRFWFQICKNFQVKGYDPYDPRIDTEKAGKALTAAENAQAIVSRYYHYGDYEKLGAYADEICGLVRYNTAAANSNGWKNNINPWTLLNVFDGDSSTNVVCEGYAEAFQYLCDLSDFDGAVACFCPTGADHKWNIVRIGGASYLMDLTMGDEGSAMDRESFFLAGGKGSVETGYRIGGFHYWYYDTTKALWGTGEDSILKLSETSYDPTTAPEADTITQDKFEAALKNCGGTLELTRKLTVSRSLDISGVALTVGTGGKITVAPGATLTVRQDASLTLTEGELLTVEAGGRLIAFGPLEGSFGGTGDVLLTQLREDRLTVSGQGTVCDGDLDSLMGTARSVGARTLQLTDGITGVGAKAFDGWTGLEEVTFPESLNNLGTQAFSGCTGLKTVTFRGDAPEMENPTDVFADVTATVYYPRNNDTWTESVVAGFGENLTLVGDCSGGHTVEIIPGIPPTCVDYGIADGAYCSVCGEILAERTILMPTGIHTYTDENDTVCDVCGAELILEEEFPFSKYEWEVLKLTNKKRLAAGAAPLTGFSKLQKAGDIRARELAKLFSHTRPDGTACFTVLQELGLDYRSAGENIASGYKTPADVVSGWMNSPGHRENMLNPNFAHMGVGEENRNWVQMFISGAQYASIRLSEGDYLTVDPGTKLEKLDLVGILMGRWGMCYLPIAADYCQGYDPDAVGDQQVTISVLGVSTTVTVHIHDWQAATCTEPKHCASCDVTEGKALGHDYKTVINEPTCTEAGSSASTCSRCGDAQEVQIIPPLGHDPAADAPVAPGCEETGLTEGSHCGRCGEILASQEEIAALGHIVRVEPGHAPTCIRTGLSDGQYCDRCDKVLLAHQILPATGHDFENGICRICGSEDKADFQLFSGKSVTLKAAHPDTGEILTAKQAQWSLPEDFAPFASVSKTGKLTAKKVFERVRVEVLLTLLETGESVSYFADIYPVLTQAEVKQGEALVNGKTVFMDVSESAMTLKVDTYPMDTLEKVTWTVSDKKNQYAEYATEGDTLVISNPKGKAGTVTIKATVDAGVKKNITVKVQFGSFAREVEIFEPVKTTLRGGESLTLTGRVSDPVVVSKPGVTWTTSDKNAATVSSSGKITAKNVAHPTLVTITATSKDGQAKASIDLEIVPKNEGQLVLMHDGAFVTNATVAMNFGDTRQITASSIVDGQPVSEEVTWTSSKETVAYVADGLITATGAGSAKITATAADGRKAVINVKVATLVDAMTITTKDGKNIIEENGEKLVILSSGKNVALVAEIPTQGANKAVDWAITEGEAYAKIAGGKVTANKDLTKPVYITVKATAKDGSGVSATIRVKIVPLATGVQIFESGSRVRSNTTYISDLTTNSRIKLSAKVYPAKANQAVELTSSNKKIAEFIDGELVCYKTGTVTITAKALDGSNAKATFKLTVVKKITSLTLKEGANLTVVGGKSLKLAPMVQISPADATNKKLTWKVAPNDYGIKVSSTGVLSTRKVTKPVVVNIMVTPQDDSGQMLSFYVTVNP